MKTFNTQKELLDLIEDDSNELVILGDITLNFDLDCEKLDLITHSINCKNINVSSINAVDGIRAENIKTKYLESGDVHAETVKAETMYIVDIDANEVECDDIQPMHGAW